MSPPQTTEHIVDDDRPVGTSRSPIWWRETCMLISLAIPNSIVNLGMFMPQAIAASFVGRRLGTDPLNGFTLGNLTANLVTLSLLQGVFAANDTLSPQAFGGKNYREVGLLAVRGFVVSLLAILPFNVLLYFFLEPALLALAQPVAAAAYASLYYRFYMLSLPFYILYGMVWKFLAAQEVMKPFVVVFFCCVPVLFAALDFFTDRFGLAGSALALDFYMATQALLLVLYLLVFKPHHECTWQGFGWRRALAVEPVMAYVKLAIGGITAQAEWVFWEVFGLICGSFGVIPLNIQTIAVHVVFMSLVVPTGLAIALTVRVGATISKNPQLARKIMIWTFVGGISLIVVLALLTYWCRYRVFALFTTDPDVIAGADKLWWKVTSFAALAATYEMTVFCSSALGIQWIAGVVTSILVWCVALPSVLISSVWLGGGLECAWSSLLLPYAVMVAFLIYRYVVFDWDGLGETVHKREEEGRRMNASEAFPLLDDATTRYVTA